MPEESPKTTRTTISMPDEELTKFKEFAEESMDYSSFSHFLRAAAHAEMEGGHQPDGSVKADTGELEADVADMKDQLRQFHGEMQDIRQMFETIEIRTRQPGEEIEELQDELFEVLPDEEQTELAASADGEVTVESLFNSEYKYADENPVPGWPASLAEAVDATRRADVAEALDQMSQTMGVVQRTEIGDKPWYYRRV